MDDKAETTTIFICTFLDPSKLYILKLCLLVIGSSVFLLNFDQISVFAAVLTIRASQLLNNVISYLKYKHEIKIQ